MGSCEMGAQRVCGTPDERKRVRKEIRICKAPGFPHSFVCRPRQRARPECFISTAYVSAHRCSSASAGPVEAVLLPCRVQAPRLPAQHGWASSRSCACRVPPAPVWLPRQLLQSAIVAASMRVHLCPKRQANHSLPRPLLALSIYRTVNRPHTVAKYPTFARDPLAMKLAVT